MSKGCKYCNYDDEEEFEEAYLVDETMLKHARRLGNNSDCLVVYIRKKFLHTWYAGPYYEKEVETKINYCPMCGTNLKELYKDEE